MAVSITAKDPAQVLAAFDVSDSLIQKWSAYAGSVDVTTQGIKLSHSVAGEQFVQVKSGAVSMALASKLGAASKASVSFKLKKALETLLANLDGEPVPENLNHMKDSAVAAVTTSKQKPKPKASEIGLSKDFPKHGYDTVPSITDLDEVFAKKPVLLKDADTMYQPVKGTSGGSIYFLVAISDDMKVAARYKGTTLSLRVEGNVAGHKQRLEKAGFGLSNLKQGYVSVHMEVSDNILASKTIGAVLAGLQTYMATPVPNVAVIQGKGK